MKASQFFISTLKEAPADAEVVSHRLMMRAGFIKRLVAGIYTYMPMGLRVIRKVEAIMREEMNRAGAVELLMPVVQPAELWQESGRFQKYGPELLRVKDRHDRDFVDPADQRRGHHRHRPPGAAQLPQLPKNFYHIQTKFRDERRPRFGVMRGREFTMKDAYSFDRDVDAAEPQLRAMYDAYGRIFDRFGLTFRAVAADTGAIGGDALARVPGDRRHRRGRDRLLPGRPTTRPTSRWPRRWPPAAPRAAPAEPLQKTPTPGKSTCEDVAALARHAAGADGQVAGAGHRRRRASRRPRSKTTVWLLLVRGDHALNEIKAGKLPGLRRRLPLRDRRRDRRHFGCKPGYLGPIGADARPVQGRSPTAPSRR